MPNHTELQNMKLITPEKELATLKSKDTVVLECIQCAKQFETMVKNVKMAIKGYQGITCNFCSRECVRKSADKRIQTSCKYCDKSFLIQRHKALTSGNFCSLSCSASYNNGQKTPKSRCLFCDSPLRSGKKFCSSNCQNQLTYTTYITKWKNQEVNGSAGVGHLSSHIRRYMLEKNGHKCSQCGFNTPHPLSGIPPLQIDHVDGNWRNNTESNLKVLCPNCHALTPTFGGRNRGFGRHKILKDAGYSSR